MKITPLETLMMEWLQFRKIDFRKIRQVVKIFFRKQLIRLLLGEWVMEDHYRA